MMTQEEARVQLIQKKRFFKKEYGRLMLQRTLIWASIIAALLIWLALMPSDELGDIVCAIGGGVNYPWVRFMCATYRKWRAASKFLREEEKGFNPEKDYIKLMGANWG